MFKLNRRNFLMSGLLAPLVLTKTHAETTAACAMDLTGIHLETDESPFFEHYHAVFLPVAAVINPPKGGIVLETSPFDKAAYDVEAFEKLLASSHLKRDALLSHTHKFTITKEQLEAIGKEQLKRIGVDKIERIGTELTLQSKETADPFTSLVDFVEVRILSEATGNYVHNLKIAPYQSTLTKVRKLGKI